MRSTETFDELSRVAHAEVSNAGSTTRRTQRVPGECAIRGSTLYVPFAVTVRECRYPLGATLTY